MLNRNPDNFFAETEQVAFCAAHVVPGIDFTNDPLLAGRIHSYVDTQISRLGGPNFHEIPINAPVAQVHNNQRDGMHRQAINRGRVSYEPNSLGGGCPFQAGAAGFVSFPEPREAERSQGARQGRSASPITTRRRTLFWNSQTPVEQTHIVNAFRFELSKVQTPAIRERMVSGLLNVAPELAEAVAEGLGIARAAGADAEGPAGRRHARRSTASPALSLFARPGDGGIADAARRHPRRRRRATAAPLDGARRAPGRAKARCRGSSARARRGRGASTASRSRSTRRSRRRRRSSSTPWSCPTATRRSTRSPPTAGRWSSSRTSTATASRSSPPARPPRVLRDAGIPDGAADGQPDPGLLAGEAGEAIVDAFVSALAQASALRA